MPRPPKPAIERLLARCVPADGGCVVYTGAVDRDGYGQISVMDGPYRHRQEKAHRVAYEHFVGPLVDGLTIDHLCFTKACVNPHHLEQVPRAENTIRGISRNWMLHEMKARTTCQQGHEYDAKNTYVDKSGGRHCRKCDAERHALRRKEGKR